MKVYSVFKSISGECGGPIKQGEWCVFVRLSGCCLKCTYCDTTYAQEIDSGTEMTPQQVLDKVFNEVGEKGIIQKVLITGGEPLLQRDDLTELCYLLKNEGFSVSIETNGSIEPNYTLTRVVDWFVFDYKTPSSWMNDKMMDFEKIKYPCSVKFVCVDQDDLDSVLAFVMKHGTRYFEYWISPCMTNHFVTPPTLDNVKIKKHWNLSPNEIMEWIRENNLYFIGINTQLHKLLAFEESL
jgi:7-carboxy-7-deazaguanine synthase